MYECDTQIFTNVITVVANIWKYLRLEIIHSIKIYQCIKIKNG